MRGLKAVVVGLGVVVVVAFGVLVWGVYLKAKDPSLTLFAPATNREAPSRRPGFGTVDLDLPQGCAIAAVQAEGGRVVVHIGPAHAPCDRVVIVDAASGAVIGTIMGARP